MLIRQLLESYVPTKSPSELGVQEVYRTDKPHSFFKGKSIWGVGRYYSVSLEDSKNIDDGGTIKTYKLSNSLKLIEFDLTWKNRDRSDADYERLHSMINKHPNNVDGFVVLSKSLQYGFSQVVIFPQAQNKVEEIKR